VRSRLRRARGRLARDPRGEIRGGALDGEVGGARPLEERGDGLASPRTSIADYYPDMNNYTI